MLLTVNLQALLHPEAELTFYDILMHKNDPLRCWYFLQMEA